MFIALTKDDDIKFCNVDDSGYIEKQINQKTKE